MGKHILRDKTGKFRSTKPAAIVAGRLYGFRGIPVRAGNDRQHAVQGSDVLRHVTCHKMLHGFVPEAELKVIDQTVVKQYLQQA
jgi:hypothetical protein